MMGSNKLFDRKGLLRAAGAVALLAFLSTPLPAVQGQRGNLTWSWDNTLSYGLLWRLDDPDPAIIGLANGGRAFSVNGDDGDLNYKTGIASNAATLTSELQISYGNVGAFVRGYGLYDYENEDGTRARTPLTAAAKRRVGSRAELRDAFAWYRFGPGGRTGEIRVGRQVINWARAPSSRGASTRSTRSTSPRSGYPAPSCATRCCRSAPRWVERQDVAQHLLRGLLPVRLGGDQDRSGGELLHAPPTGGGRSQSR